MKKRLYSFGYNAFLQTGEKQTSTIVKTPQCHAHINRIIFANWESTILINDESNLVFWGYKPALSEKLEKITDIESIHGELDSFLGVVNKQHELSVLTPEKDHIKCMDDIVQAVYCQQQSSLFVLTEEGAVYQYEKTHTVRQLHKLPPVKKISSSETCVLFQTKSDVYGLGSNKLAQLGMDYQQQQLDEPTLIEYFCGFQHISDIDCGPFHSAVIVDGEVYTFGWSKEGRLGWGSIEEKDDIISFATFLDVNDQPVDIHAVKVVCGSAHTLVLDDKGKVWSCGSNKYGQLGRDLKDKEYDEYFRRCTLFDFNTEQAIDCYTGHWTSFIMTKLL